MNGRIKVRGAVAVFIVTSILMLVNTKSVFAAYNFSLYRTPTANSRPEGIAVGSDGNMWFTEPGVGKIGRATPSGNITEYGIPGTAFGPNSITSTSDGSVWFPQNNTLGRYTVSGVYTHYNHSGLFDGTTVATGPDGNIWFTINNFGLSRYNIQTGTFTDFQIPGFSYSVGMTAGSDGNLWVVDFNNHSILKITPNGDVEGNYIQAGYQPQYITSGPDGNMWFTDYTGKLGRITLGGVTTIFNFPPQYITHTPRGITAGPDGSLWFTNEGYMGRITTDGVITLEGVNDGFHYAPNQVVLGPDGNLWFTGEGISTGDIVGVFRLRPLSPSNLSAQSPTQSPYLTWNGVSGATSYNIYRNNTKINSVTAAAYADASAPEGTDSYFVTAVNSGGESDHSSSISVLVDRTNPVITYTLAPVSNADGWNKGNLTVSFTCTDGSSGVASCTSPVTLTNEGAGQIVTGTATDNAGNSANTTATVNIDKTAPAISYTLSPAPNSNGWNNGDVTVTFQCSDELSGIKTCTNPVTLSTDGANQTVTGTATDKAGNSSSVTATVNVDKTLPIISYTASPAANSHGWNGGDVTVTFSCNDSLSGVASCSAPATLSSEGYFQTVTGTATDNAGNVSTIVATINIDRTAPVVTYSVTPAPNTDGWNKNDVVVSFNCSDNLSGIDACSSPITLAADGSNQTATGTATDNAGNTASVTATVNIDKTDPTISYAVAPTPNSNGWNNGNVTVTFTCNDSLSGVAACTDPVILSAEGSNQLVTGTATDNAGNTSSVTSTVKIDKVAPNISYTLSPTPNSNGWNSGNVTVSFSCSDAGSGIDVCPGSTVLTNEGGGQIITGTATDKAGNSASTSVMVNIDKTAPVVSNLSWSANPLQQGQNTTLSAMASDSLSDVAAVSYTLNGGTPQPMTYDTASGKWKATFGSSLAANTYNIVVTATDLAGNTNAGAVDVLAVYTTSNGYVTGHAKILPTSGDTMPIALDTSSNPANLVLGFTNVTSPMSGSFDIDYSIKNNQNEFSLSSTSLSWVVVQDSTHASILGHADMTKYVNGVQTLIQNVAVRFDITLGINGAPDQVTIKIFNPGIDPNTGTPTYVISDVVISNGSNLMIHP